MASSIGTESAAGITLGSTQAVGYNTELPAPGVVIKQDTVFVEGIAHDMKKFVVCLRVAKAGHVSLLFYPENQTGEKDTSSGLMGGFVLKRDEDGVASASCALAKKPRANFDFCLRCDFTRMSMLSFRLLIHTSSQFLFRGASNCKPTLGIENEQENCFVFRAT
jgi:hypothetical protein